MAISFGDCAGLSSPRHSTGLDVGAQQPGRQHCGTPIGFAALYLQAAAGGCQRAGAGGLGIWSSGGAETIGSMALEVRSALERLSFGARK